MKPHYPKMFLSLVLLLAGCGPASDEEIQARLSEAQDYFSGGEYRAAIIESKSVLQEFPGNLNARLLLGRVYIELGRGADAEKELRLVLVKDAEREVEITPLLARALLLQNRPAPVIEVLAQVADSESMADVFSLRGEAYLALDQADKASAAFEKALKIDEKAADPHVGLARMASLKNDTDTARRQLGLALELEPDHSQAWYWFAQSAMTDLKFEEAEKAFVRVLDTQPGDIVTPLSFLARVHLVRAQIALQKYDLAERNAKKLLAASKNHPAPSYLMALIAYQRGDLIAAEPHLQNVLRVVDGHKGSILLMGGVSYQKGNYEQANEYLSKIVAAVPTYIPARKLLGAARIKLAQPKEALSVLMPALSEQEKADGELLQLVGEAAFQMGDRITSRDMLVKALNLDPTNESIRATIATTFLAENNPQEALKVLEGNSNQGSSYIQDDVILVMAYLKSGAPDKALDKAKLLARDNPKNAALQNLLGSIYEALGDISQAEVHLESALTLQPNMRQANTNLAGLDLRRQRYLSAGERYASLLEDDPKNVHAMLGLAIVADRTGKAGEVEKWLLKAIKVAPEAVQTKLYLSEFYLRHGQLNKAETFVSSVIEVAPSHAPAYVILAEVQLTKGQKKQGVQSLHKALDLSATNRGVSRHIARLFYQAGEIKQARAIYLDMLQSPAADDLYILAELAHIEAKSGQFNSALARVERLKSIDSSSAIGDEVKGDIYMMKKAYSDALASYNRAALRVDSLALANKRFDAVRLGQGQRAAYDFFEGWVKKHPDSIAGRAALAEFYHKGGESAQATNHYEAVLKQSPRDPYVLNNLAWLYLEQGEDRAIEAARAAYNEIPNNADIMDTYGWVLSQLGQAEKGLPILKQALGAKPNDAMIRLHYEKTQQALKAKLP